MRTLPFIGIILAAFLIAACSTVETKKAQEKEGILAYFPMDNGCNWIYKVESYEKEHLISGDYLVRVVKAEGDTGILSFNNNSYNYTMKSDGILNNSKGYFVLKDPKENSWDITGGKAEIAEANKKITTLLGEMETIVVKESFPAKKFYTMSYYAKSKGLVKFDVFITNEGKDELASSMDIKSYICSDK